MAQEERLRTRKPWDKHTDPWWIVVAGFVIIGVILGFAFKEVSSLYWTMGAYIVSDFQLIIAFFLFFGVTIGWMCIKSACRIFMYIRRRAQGQDFDKKFLVFGRFFSGSVLFLMILFRYVTIWDFFNWELYLMVGSIELLLLIIFFKTGFGKFLVEHTKSRGITLSEDNKRLYVPYEVVFSLFVVIGMIIVMVYYYFLGPAMNVLWVKEFVDSILMQFLVNPLFGICIGMLVISTVLYWLVKLLYYLGVYASYEVQSDDTAKKVKRTRIWSLVFIFALLTIKYLTQVLTQGPVSDWLNVVITLIIAACWIVSWIASVKAKMPKMGI